MALQPQVIEETTPTGLSRRQNSDNWWAVEQLSVRTALRMGSDLSLLANSIGGCSGV
jgi:hypothetical protein